MKKIAFVLALGFMLQSVPSRVLASVGPPPPVPGAGAVAALALLGFTLFGGDNSSANAKTGNEFADLNNNPAFKDLLKQQAGGSMNTLDILK